MIAGLLQAPATVGESLKAGRLIAGVMSQLGYKVVPPASQDAVSCPSFITAVELGSREAMIEVCRAI